jgi:heme-degrading monooxygenase HmoA
VYVGMTTTRGKNDDMVGLARISGETMAPWLREIEGFMGLLMLSSQETGVTHVLTFWESREVAEMHREARRSLRDRITATVDVEVLQTEEYEVAFADLPAVSSS